jgi:hypothetical protein
MDARRARTDQSWPDLVYDSRVPKGDAHLLGALSAWHLKPHRTVERRHEELSSLPSLLNVARLR